MNQSAVERSIADFVRAADRLPGACLPWLTRARREALERFAAHGIPTTRDEEWKYTSLANLEKHAFAVPLEICAGYGQAAPLLAAHAMHEHHGHLLVFHNGRYAPALSTPGPLPAGVKLGSLATALKDTPDTLEPHLTDRRHQTIFGALNTAFMTDGAYLHLARGSAVEEPIHLLFISTQAGAALSGRNLIVAEENTQATVIEHYVGTEGVQYFNNVVTQIFAAAEARIEHYKLQQEAGQAFHIAGIHAQQGRSSRLHSHSIALGSGLMRNDITTSFDATGCEAALDGLYLAGGRQHLDHHTRIDHLQANGTSREYYRGVLDDVSRAVFNGKVVVHPGATKTNAHQANHNLLLSRNAEIDSKPQLEIHADDVQCTHGATIGQIDDAQIFYLRSRGVEEAMARAMLVHAFAHDVIERIRVPALRKRLEQVLFARLPQGERLRELT